MVVSGSSGKGILLLLAIWKECCALRFARSILVALLKIHGTSLIDESLQTFLAEAETVVNTRPITIRILSDVHSPVPLCPMQLLALKSRVVMPPPGEFQKEDIYCRKQWRRVQDLANESGGRRKLMQPCKFVINGTKL